MREGFDMDIIPTDLATYAGEAKNILRDLQSRNERMFLMTFLVVNFADSKQKLENDLLRAASVAQKYNCSLVRLDFQQEDGFVSVSYTHLNPDNRIVRNYLTAVRRIDEDVSGFFFSCGDLYEEAAHHNACLLYTSHGTALEPCPSG